MSIFASGGFIWFCCPWCPKKPLQPPCLKRCNPRPSREPLPSCSWGMWQWHLWWLRSWCAQASVAQIWTKDWSTLHHWIVDISIISLQENGRLYYDPLLSPGAKLHHDKAGAQGRDAELQTWKHNTRGGQKFTKWNMMEHGHSCPKRSCPCHTLLQYYARHTCCWKELWEVREVEDQDICTQSLVESLCSSDQSVGWYIVCTLLWRTSVQDWVQAQKHSPTQVHGYQCVLEAEATQAPIIISN